jgi:hypothetical protein
MYEIDQFDSPLPEPFDTTPLERTKRRQRFWAKVFYRGSSLPDRMQLEAWHSHRVALGYRVVREIARIKQVAYDNESLGELLEQDDFDGWLHPLGEPEIIRGTSYTQLVQKAFIPLLPPLRSSEYASEIPVYFDVVRAIVRRLGLAETEDGRRGFIGMTDLSLYEECWPTLEEILAYENRLLHEVVSTIGAEGSLKARNDFMVKHNMRRWEMNNLFSLAVQGSVELMSGTLEEERAIMLLRLENFVQRCRTEEGGDLRAELAALKLVADIQNLRKAKSADETSEMVDVVRAEVRKEEAEDKKELGNS